MMLTYSIDIVMEYVRGGTLADYVMDHNTKIKQALGTILRFPS